MTNASNVEDNSGAGTLGYAVMGFVFAAAYQVSVPIIAFVIYATGATDSLRLLMQLAAGFLLSILAYTAVSNPSLKFGMRVYFGLVAGTLFLIGGYTILSSLFSL